MPLCEMRGEGSEGPSEVWMLAAGPTVAALAGRQVAASASFVSPAPRQPELLFKPTQEECFLPSRCARENE